jgi:SOS response regulatory protein OraA/RecX
MDIDLHKLLLKKAGALLARRAYSRVDLQAKLAAFADEQQVDAALQHLERLDLLNDSDYAYNFALRRIRQRGWSLARVQNELLAHHVGSAIIDRALEKVSMESGGEESGIREYMHKRYGKSRLPADPKGVRKLILHLQHRGFDEATIFRALRGVIPDAVLKHFETGESID